MAVNESVEWFHRLRPAGTGPVDELGEGPVVPLAQQHLAGRSDGGRSSGARRGRGQGWGQGRERRRRSTMRRGRRGSGPPPAVRTPRARKPAAPRPGRSRLWCPGGARSRTPCTSRTRLRNSSVDGCDCQTKRGVSPAASTLQTEYSARTFGGHSQAALMPSLSPSILKRPHIRGPRGSCEH
jgi:hypothetical protein